MINFKTNFVERFYNLNQEIKIYDLDGTIIDSSHRIRFDENGNLDLEHWKRNSTKEQIFQDDLLPLYWQLVQDYKSGHIVVLCTARNFGKWDWEYLHTMGIYYDYVITRPDQNTTADDVLKSQTTSWLFNLKPFRDMKKTFYDDNIRNLYALARKGADVVNARTWNERFSI
jgi:hypothetical protein